MQLLCVRIEQGQEDRTECLWSNFTPEPSNGRHFLPATVKGQIRAISDAASLSFTALDERIDEGLGLVAKDWNAMLPYMLEMNRRLSAPGKRCDLRKGAPVDLTWTAWVDSKRSMLGRSLRSVQRLLQGKTEASLSWRARPNLTTLCREVPGELIPPDSVMSIAFEMARLVLEMRSNGRNTPHNKRKLERLAVRFLKMLREKNPDSVGELASKEPGYTM
jgi:hypothetical protein